MAMGSPSPFQQTSYGMTGTSTAFSGPTKILPSTTTSTTTTTTFAAGPSVEERLGKIKSAWDTTSPDCRFHAALYNKVEPAQVGLYTRPPGVQEVVWARAVRGNPDPESLVPAIAFGYDDLHRRVAAQVKEASRQYTILEQIQGATKRMASAQELRLDDALRKTMGNHDALVRRTARLVRRTSALAVRVGPPAIDALTPAGAGAGAAVGEEALRERIETLVRAIERSGSLRARLEECKTTVEVQRARGRLGLTPEESSGVDERGLDMVAHVLSEQQNGLNHLVEKLLEYTTVLGIAESIVM